MNREEYPECEKLSAVSDERRTLSEFFEWLESRGMLLCTYEPDFQIPWPVTKSNDTLIYEFLEIDPKKLDQERRAMLASLTEDAQPTCEHPKDLYAPHCTEISCINYAGRFVR